MSLRIITLILFLSSVSLYSSAPVPRAYQFGAFDLESLLPFSYQELDIMHRQNVKQVYFEDDSWRTLFIFNAKGQLARTMEMEAHDLGKKKEYWKPLDSTLYEYDAAGRLLTKKYYGTCIKIRCDSMTYDAQGRLMSYDSYERLRANKHNPHPSIYSYHRVYFLRFENGYALMKDTAMGETMTCYMNENNICQKIVTDYGRDSISFSCTGNTCTETFWYKEDSAAYRVGQVVRYEDKQMLSMTIYDATGGVARDYRYYYNAGGQLIQLINMQNVNYTKYYYCYDEHGIKTEEIMSDYHSVKRKLYQYVY